MLHTRAVMTVSPMAYNVHLRPYRLTRMLKDALSLRDDVNAPYRTL